MTRADGGVRTGGGPGAGVVLLAGTVVGLDGGTQERDATEHLLLTAVDQVRGAGAEVPLACTHFVRTPAPHWAASVLVRGRVPELDLPGVSVVAVDEAGGTRTDGSQDWALGAAGAAEQLLSGNGRVVVFDGHDRLPASLPVEDVPALTAIQEVRGVGGTDTAGHLLHTRGYVRPDLVDGRLVLHVRPFGEDGNVAPFEVPNPTPCCAAHS